jgi:hypothetical protein
MKTAIADTIKTLSDNAISATIIVVGVADSVDDLIKEHYSIERALVQIQMPRMSPNERYEIIEKGLKHLKMTIEENAKKYISNLSQGLPHYIHSLALHAARVAIDKKTKHIVDAHIEIALEKALEGAQQSTKNLYHKAITSVKKNNIYAQVLLACSLAKTDSLGYFAAVDVREPLSSIMKKAYSIASFSRHLKDFCKEARGPILQQFGTKHRYRFRFANPLMQPYITMKGIKDGKIENLELFPGRMPVS